MPTEIEMARVRGLIQEKIDALEADRAEIVRGFRRSVWEAVDDIDRAEAGPEEAVLRLYWTWLPMRGVIDFEEALHVLGSRLPGAPGLLEARRIVAEDAAMRRAAVDVAMRDLERRTDEGAEIAGDPGEAG